MFHLLHHEKDIDCPRVRESFYKTVSRGPDMSEIKELPTGYLGFHRLAIMGLTAKGMQPFARGKDFLICNGEIYGFRPLKRALEEKGYRFLSDSDCEILLPLYRECGVKMFKILDAEFALVLYDGEQNKYIAARDPIGSARSTSAIRRTAPSSLRASRKILWGSSKTSSPSPGLLLCGRRVHPLCGRRRRLFLSR